jgi:YHS domain-containing protein
MTTVLAAVPLAPQATAATNELVVADRLAGVALFGFDPVSYFLDGSARTGTDAFELQFNGLVWRFRSEANRAAFRERPDSYVPRFGGYDPIALVRGAPVAGHPAIFLIHDGQLFLFSAPETREKFLSEPNGIVEAARSAWPLVRRSLVH